MCTSVIKIHPDDNVMVALADLEIDKQINNQEEIIQLKDAVSRGHKVAIATIPKGEMVIKYGKPIGHATHTIGIGEHVHSHNMRTNLGDVQHYQYHPTTQRLSVELPDRAVNLYRRRDGKVGIRNELWIIPTVSCVNGIATALRDQFRQLHQQTINFDGVHVLTHPYGCSQLGDDHQHTRTILQDMVKHPNAGGILVLGLGCENNQVAEFKATLGEYDSSRVQFMICQQEDDELATGLMHLEHLHHLMQQDRRQSGLLSEVVFGLECGGSDGLSGITANPLLGHFSDYTIAHGGSTVLTEVPEMFGAEHILMAHCHNRETFDKTVSMINAFKHYFIVNNQPIYENPSPGNKAGGITTLEDKSLGCTQKAGQSSVIDVLAYGECLTQKGLNLLSAPGNDAVATSALAAAGCHMVLFSTGRGTPYGGPVPTLKLATNNELATKKSRWIDFNAGSLLNGVSMSQLLADFIDMVVDKVNGDYTCNERNHCRDLTILKTGVTL